MCTNWAILQADYMYMYMHAYIYMYLHVHDNMNIMCDYNNNIIMSVYGHRQLVCS